MRIGTSKRKERAGETGREMSRPKVVKTLVDVPHVIEQR